jgi:LAO/AO transport system kinase
MPRARLSVSAYTDGIRAGDRAVLAQAITLVESTLPADQPLAAEVLQACHEYIRQSGLQSFRLGITGSPGVGKSTFIEAFGLLLAEQGHRLAVLSIDPSSQRSGGSILGDKTRMQHLANHPQVYIRPSPSGQSLGGVNGRTREALLLLEAAGFGYAIVETVGVGQSETLVHRMADFFLLLQQPAGGDSLQGIKRGVMELTDGLVVTKADGPTREAATRAAAEYRAALHLMLPPPSGWAPFVQTVSALERTGLAELHSHLQAFRQYSTHTGWHTTLRQQQHAQWFHDLVQQQLYQRFWAETPHRERHHHLLQQVTHGELAAPFAVLQALGVVTR